MIIGASDTVLEKSYRPIKLTHLQHMTDRAGLFEHARFSRPRIEHGYCVDDVARGLIVTVRESNHTEDSAARDLSRVYLDFLTGAQEFDGRMRNRRNARGDWTDSPNTFDAWGRALWGLGTTVAESADLADEALALFNRSARQRSSFSRSMIFASLGAAEVLRVIPEHDEARNILRATVAQLASAPEHPHWPWPEERLTYANACLAEVVIAAGDLLGDPALVDHGLRLLEWLVGVETRDGHVSVTPVGGWAHGEPRPAFDQQPIEVAALAEAAALAHELTGDADWAAVVAMCVAWFDGDNDSSTPMANYGVGSGFDGLERDGRNENCGAESTLAMLATHQQARRIAMAMS